jgi:hypothetical protein
MTRRYNRRRFLTNSAMLVMAVPAFPGISDGLPLVKPAGYDNVETGPLTEGLEKAFVEPPDAAWPWVYWFVSDGNLTREGITADFEAMKRVGIRGVLYMEVDQYVPKGPARFLGRMWREMIQHAVKEATRLGITINMNNDGGWCGSAGPWITPELSMQMVVWSETVLRGPTHFRGTLPQPKTIEDYYRDIATIAFPLSSAASVRMAESSPKLTYGTDRKGFDFAKLIDGNPGTVALLPPPERGQPQYLNIEFPEPFTAQALTVAMDTWNSRIEGALEVSDDGQHFRTIRPLIVRWPVSSVNFPKVTARYYRLLLRPRGDWFFQQFADGIPLGEVELHADSRIEDVPGKAAYIRQDAFSGEPAFSPETTIHRDQVVDLSSRMDGQGQLTWDVPDGKWVVVRFGHTSTGKMNHPAPKESLGLECDKLSKKAIEVHFAGLMGKLLEDQASVGGKSLTMTHIDSWEVGSQNWTAGFREEFQKRCRYDLLPFLPVLTGRAVESRQTSERFLWDLRRLVADLVLENYAGHMREISHQHGLTLSIEAYGGGPLDDVAYGGRADVPMSEFWTGREPGIWNKEMASSAHVYGHPVVAAESFTATPENGKWQNHPFRLKPLGDLAFTQGVNRFVFHRYSAQPWLNRKPGMTMGPWGIHYERTNTWWEQSAAWLSYLARCQHLLQSGRFVADVVYLGSEDAPNSFPDRGAMDPAIPPGYDFDQLPPEVLMKQATVQDGRLVLASGMSYRVLVLPPGRAMTAALLGKIRELVFRGATVVGPRPSSSPSLVDYPQCDTVVQRLAAELWGECDGTSITENRCGSGKIIWGNSLARVLRDLDTHPDFECPAVTVGDEIRYIHRYVGGDDIYFVASAVPEARRFLCTFRIKGKRPELWWPDTGRTEPAAIYNEQDGRTLIPLSLDPYGSVFVVFRGGTAPLPDRVVSVRRNGIEISGLAPKPAPEIQLRHEFGAVQVDQKGGAGFRIETAQAGVYELKTAARRKLKAEIPDLPNPVEIDGPWLLEFPKGLGAPERVTLERLLSWTDHPDPGVKHFSGIATYRRQFETPARMLAKDRRLCLDLGRVSVIAQVKLNGHDLGVLWKPPFHVDVTNVLQAGANNLEISVVNLWPNRLIGDEQLPSDCEWTPQHWGEVLSRWPQWLVENKPSPAGRVTFTTWKHWTSEDPLMESGLLGPIRIVTKARVTAK